MTEAYKKLGPFILFRELLTDELGHLYRAGEVEGEGVKRTVFLRIFDGAGIVAGDLIAQHQVANQISQILESANVASKSVYFEHEGVPGMAWTHSSAQPLSLVFEKVRQEGFPVPVDNALLILEKLALALSAALAVDVGGASLLHGFLHPGMAVVTNDGEAVVSGFGIAEQLHCLLDHPEAAASVAPYLAPEVLAARTPSKQGDVYSLGAMLYQLLTGIPLPVDPDARAAALAQAELAYDEGPIPDDIRGVLDRCLAQRPEERFSSAADFKKELDKLLYGGAYSPTTFNLALFMDRLFRPEIEADERERLEESGVDVSLYLTPEPEPEEFPDEVPSAPSKAPWILAAAAVAVALVVAGYFLLGGGGGGGVPPTPTPEEVLAQREAQQRQVETLVQEQVARMMEQREEELRAEFAESQAQIDDLTKQLKAKERELNQGGQTSAAAQREKERLQREIAAAEAQKRRQEAALEEERQRLLDDARRRMAEQRAASATRAAQEQAAESAEATPPPEVASAEQPGSAAAVPTSAPSTEAAPPQTRPRQPTETVVENTFVEFTEVDTRPEELKRHQVVWPRLAIHSRRKGVVILSATVDAEGRVEEVSVLRADDKGFGIPQAAMDAVRRYVYKPATKGGVKVKTSVTVTLAYNFRQR